MVRLIATLAAAAGLLAAGDAGLEQARKLYNHTDFDQSLKVLLSIQD
jgi:hypothetical protein